MTIEEQFQGSSWKDKPLSAVRCGICDGRMHEAGENRYYCTHDKSRFRMDPVTGELTREKDARYKSGGRYSLQAKIGP